MFTIEIRSFSAKMTPQRELFSQKCIGTKLNKIQLYENDSFYVDGPPVSDFFPPADGLLPCLAFG